MTPAGLIGIFGGTFDPVHRGHLNSARALLERVPCEQIRFVPAARPPHRGMPAVSAEHRAAMLELAIVDEPRFVCDRRELLRSGPSYMVETLESLRAEIPATRPVALLLGCDAFLGLPGWHRWEELLGLAHLLVIARPGWSLPAEGELAAMLRDASGAPAALATSPAGLACCVELPPEDVSATAIRALLQSGGCAEGLVPDPVLAYIEEQGLYH